MKRTIFLMFVFALVLSLGFAMAAETREVKGIDAPKLTAKLEKRTADIEGRLQNKSANMEAKISKLQERLTTRLAKLDELKNKTAAKLNATINFGQCVSTLAEEKNGCFNATKEKRDACLIEETGNKTLKSQCLADYKQEMDECKNSFKDVKSKSCGSIKHNFLDSLSSMFK